MEEKYGFLPKEWEKAREEMRAILIEQAKNQELITYTELVERITAIRLEPESYALFRMLWEVTSEEDAARRGMLTAIVVHKDDSRPGSGFFRAADELGKDTSDQDRFWINELKKVYKIWRTEGAG